jgi:MoaA/NifB/PqqE/SkfB family radical SAM enzyme
MLDILKGFHLETTNICTLKCPRCARTDFIETFKNKNWTNSNLNLDNLKSFIDIDITGLTFVINGNYGDPIYYPDLFDLVTYIKDHGASIILHTNGSYKTTDWWTTFAGLVDSTDIINFSIDGLPENFTQYRVNADWTTIKQGIDIMVKSSAQIVWKYVVFSYNENDIDRARHLSKEIGMTDFIVNNSDRWIDNDWLRPSRYVDAGDTLLYNGSLNSNRTESIMQWKNNNVRDTEIDPICKKTHKSHFISADGYYMPCCFVGNHRFYYQSEFYKNKEQYKISNTTITKILTETTFYNSLEQNPPKYCTFNCPKL